MKRCISLIISIMLIAYPSITSYSASEGMDNNTEVLEYADNRFEATPKVEDKIFCDATLDDDFKDDSVIVILKNNKSKELESHTLKSFSDISAKTVTDLTSKTKNKIEKQRIKKKQAKNGYILDTSTTDEMQVDENKFHQIIKIDLDVKSKENVLACIKKLEKHDDVLMAFPNYLYKSAIEANDTGYENNNNWAIDKINLPNAWNITQGNSSIKVGVLDSGIDGNNPDLKNRIDKTLSKDYTGGNSPLTDEGGHGTAVAGIIGAEGNNNEGVTGTCWNIRLVSLKVAVPSGNHCIVPFEAIQAAIEDATDNNIPILNYSYGGPSDNTEVKIALGNYPGLFICAAGNSYTDISNLTSYPIDYNYNNTIVVAGTDKYDELYTSVHSDGTISGSNYSATKVDLAAPGKDIGTTSISSSHYTTTSGTSIAAPFVAGVAALLKSKYPAMETRTLKYYILKGVDVKTSLQGKVSTNGRLNAYKALSSVTTYTIQYDSDGGSGTMSNTKVIYNNFTPLRKNTFTKAGYTFKGWYAKRSSDNKCYYTNGTSGAWYTEGSQPSTYRRYLYEDEQTVFNSTPYNNDIVTLKAQWAPNYTIRFNGNDAYGGTMADMSVTTAIPFYLTQNTFDRGTDTMTHWYAKKGNLMYYTGANGAGWYTHGNQPSGYVRKEFTDGMYIIESSLSDIASGDIITMNAYWEPSNDILGNANQDNTLSTADVTTIQKYLGHEITLSAYQQKIADVNFSGTLTVKDATMIQKYLAKQITEFGS